MTNQPKVPISNNFFYIFPLLTLCPAEASLHSAQEQKVLEKMNKLRIKFQVHRLYGYIIKQVVYNNVIQGSGCGSVGKAVASNSRGPWFESSHWQKFIMNIYSKLNWKDENKEKEAENGPFLKKPMFLLWLWIYK